MRDYRDSKAIAHSLRDALAARSFSISHSESLELVAKILGFHDWNELSAKIRSSHGAVHRKPRAEDGLEMPILPVRDCVFFPGVIAPLFVARERTKRAIEKAVGNDKRVLVVAQRSAAADAPALEDLHRIGVTAQLLDVMTLEKGEGVKILLRGLERAALLGPGSPTDLTARVAAVEESRTEAPEAFALRDAVLEQIRARPPAVFDKFAPGLFAGLGATGQFADSVAAHLRLAVAEAQDLLETFDVVARLEKIHVRVSAVRAGVASK
jgi:ATP-dependent Lon protease